MWENVYKTNMKWTMKGEEEKRLPVEYFMMMMENGESFNRASEEIPRNSDSFT